VSIHLDTAIIADIPVLTIAPSMARGCPTVFFVPGFGGTKEDGVSLGLRLAQRGLCFAGFDPWLHGERYNPRLAHAADPALGGVYPPETGLDTGLLFYQVIHRCLSDIQALMAHFAPDARADMTRCGITGLSMGGCASYLAFASLPQLQAAVPMIGIPSFTRRWLDLLDECAFSNPDWAAALRRVEGLTAQHTALVQEIDPHDKLKGASPRALLMMNCDFDTDQPKLYSIYCYRELQSYYAAQPDRLRLNIYPAAHVVTPEMERDAVDWFCRFL
jgi:S-formylglutathione hydrolase FrmB